MTSRINESSDQDSGARSETRPNQVSMTSQPEEEGCPVTEESGTVCGETKTLNIFQEFRQLYDECIRKMEGNKEENSALRKLLPFRKLVEDIWEQNAMLIETVQELEQEATNRVAVLQNKLDECCQKVAENLKNMSEVVREYVEDVDSLVEVIQRFRKNGVIDSNGLKFNTICDYEIYGQCKSSCSLVKGARKKEKNRDVNEDTELSLTKPADGEKEHTDLPPTKTKSVSCQSVIPVTQKGSMSENVKSEKYCKCLLDRSECRCDEGFDIPSEDLSLVSLLREIYNLIDADLLKSKSKTSRESSNLMLNSSGIDETYFSTEDCTKVKRNDDDEPGKVSSDKCLYSAQVSLNRTGCSPDCGKLININLNLINEPYCHDRFVKCCVCDCSFCGCTENEG